MTRHVSPYRSIVALACLLICLLAGPALADDDKGRPIGNKFEITPFASFFFEGSIDDTFYDYDWDVYDFEEANIEEGFGHGVTMSFGVHRNVQIELTYASLESEIQVFDFTQLDHETFQRVEDDIDLEYFHVGGAFRWPIGQMEPFFMLSLGGTRIDPGLEGSDSDTKFSIGIGGGVKVFFGDHVGLRFQGRILATAIDDDEEFYCRSHDDHRHCYEYDSSTTLSQADVSVGLIFAF